jgi:hypothetical protein
MIKALAKILKRTIIIKYAKIDQLLTIEYENK